MNRLETSFDELRDGGRFTTPGRTVTETDVVSFSALTGDRHPQHADAEWARESLFGERVAHGMLVISYAVGLVAFDQRVVALRRIKEAKFKAPVRIGDTIHVEGRVVGGKPIDDEYGLVETAWRIVNQEGRTVTLMSVEAVWRRSPTGDDSDDLVAAANGGGRP